MHLLTGAVPGGDSKDDGDIQEDGNIMCRASKSPWRHLVPLRDSMAPQGSVPTRPRAR